MLPESTRYLQGCKTWKEELYISKNRRGMARYGRSYVYSIIVHVPDSLLDDLIHDFYDTAPGHPWLMASLTATVRVFFG